MCVGRWHKPCQIHLQFRTTWMSWFPPLHCVELEDISRSHLAARPTPTPTDTVWGSPKQSFPHQETSIQQGSRCWVGIQTAGEVPSECVLTWEPYQGRPQLQAHGNKWQAPHTYTHVVRLRWQCVVHVWMLYIVYADKCLKYPTYSLKTAPLPRLATPAEAFSLCIHVYILPLCIHKQYVTCWASGSAHYLSLLPLPLHSGVSPAVLDMVVGEQCLDWSRGSKNSQAFH